MNSSNKIFSFFIWLGFIGATCALGVYAYLGIFTRYMADDYCLLVTLRSADVFTASWNKYLLSSNRFSNLFVIGFWELFPNSVAFVPALHIALWVAGLTWFFYELSRLFKLKTPLLLLALLSELIVLFTFYTSPNLFQVLYWRPGQVTYLTPLVLFSFLAAWLARLLNSRMEINQKLYFPLFLFGSFFVSGLSETINALHLSLLALALISVYFFAAPPRRASALLLLGALFLGTFLGLLAMFFSPANAIRINPENLSPNFFEVISRSLQYTFAFLLGAFKALPVPWGALILTSVLISYFFFQQQAIPERNRFALWGCMLTPILAYGLIFAAFAPSAYGQSYPVERVRFAGHFILVCSLIILSVCFGYYGSRLKMNKLFNILLVSLTSAVLLYPFWMIRQPLQTYEFRRRWANYWDQRQTMIYAAIQNGETDIAIPALDGYEGTKELDAFPTYWANQCAAQYYGVQSIIAFSIEEENVLDFFNE